ncbi:MAG: hypothetical protein RR342_03710 [Bacilli bacterium]
MNIKSIEDILKENNISVKDFQIKTSYMILLEDGGAIHINNKCEITSIQGTDEMKKKLQTILRIKNNYKSPKRWKLRMIALENEIKRLKMEVMNYEKNN